MTVTIVHSQGPTESTAQDGHLHWSDGAGGAYEWLTIANASDGNGGEPDNSLVNLSLAVFVQHATNDKWQSMTRGIILFDSSTISSGDPLHSAIITIEGKAKNNPAGSQNVNVFSSAPASNTTLTVDDFDNVGETKFCDSDLAYADWDTSGANTFELNAAGLTALNLGGIGKFSFRDTAFDHSNTAPTHNHSGAYDANIQGWSMEENTTGDKRPFITITHGALPFTPRAIMF